jgi:RNA polymerase sigma-70 factor (ECF subfamily)
MIGKESAAYGQLVVVTGRTDPALFPAPNEATDAEVIARSITEPECFALIFERHFDPIHRYVSRRLGELLADDLAMQVFTLAFDHRRRFRLEVASARPWLYGIATNLIRTHRRTERRLLAALCRLGACEVPAPDPTSSAERGAELRCVAQALSGLNDGQREVLLLHAWVGLCDAEIAAALDIPVGTVGSRLLRARRRLRSALDRAGLGDVPPREVQRAQPKGWPANLEDSLS